MFSPTVTVNVHEAEFLASSVAEHVTIVCPRGKFLYPEGGTQFNARAGSKLSDTIGSGQNTRLEADVIETGHIIRGSSRSVLWSKYNNCVGKLTIRLTILNNYPAIKRPFMTVMVMFRNM